MRKFFKIIKIWVGGPIAALTFVAGLINAPKNWHTIMAYLPPWITEDTTRISLAVIGGGYLILLAWPFFKKNYFTAKISKTDIGNEMIDLSKKIADFLAERSILDPKITPRPDTWHADIERSRAHSDQTLALFKKLFLSKALYYFELATEYGIPVKDLVVHRHPVNPFCMQGIQSDLYIVGEKLKRHT